MRKKRTEITVYIDEDGRLVSVCSPVGININVKRTDTVDEQESNELIPIEEYNDEEY